MNPRTYEGPMDWEYQGSGPRDPTSPFTHAAQSSSGFGGFGSPAKTSDRPNPFANLSSPSKQSQHPPQTSRFTPQISTKNMAPPFRNPAFTTPRKPVDEVVFSEASGAEDSPGMTEASDVPNDTPEVDHMGDTMMGGTLSPKRIDKSSRYAKTLFTKKHASGKGEIRNRDSGKAGLLRKRKRHNLDRDVGSVVRYSLPDSDWSDNESDAPPPSRNGHSGRKTSGRAQQRGVIGSMFHMLDEYPNAPDNLHRWIQLILNLMVVGTVVGIGYTIVSTIRSDIFNANEAARFKRQSKMTECRKQYLENGCEKNDRPALIALCKDWHDCLMQDPDAIMHVKVTAKQIAEIINEFSETMNFKAWGFFFAVLVVCVLGNNLLLGRYSPTKGASNYGSQQHPNGGHSLVNPNNHGDGSVMWMPVATPRGQRRGLLDEREGSDTDNPYVSVTPMRLGYYTPSSRRSPSKGERAHSPIKYGRSPSKGY